MPRYRKYYKWFYDNIHSHQYDLLLKWFFFPLGGENNFREEMMEPVKFSPNDRILDLCCGTGGATLAIRRKVGENSEIIGCDLSIGQIRNANKKNKFNNVKFFEADATSTGLKDNYFDKVFIAHALHEMPRDIRLGVLTEARQVLKIGGKLIIFEVDNPDNFIIRLGLKLFMGDWLPYLINFEKRTTRDMLKYGVTNEVGQAGFINVQKISKFQGMLQVVMGEK